MTQAQPPRLLDTVRHTGCLKHLSHQTENADVNYLHRFIIFYDKRHPKEMGAEETRAFLK